VGELLAESADIRAGERVLDVAAGNGNATLAAARRFADVTSTDYVPELLEKGALRAQAEGLSIRFETADVEALPYADGSFDAVLSTFGVMFAPDRRKSAAEMLRVLRGGGRIGLASWILKAFAALDTEARHALEGELVALLDRFNRGGAGSLVVPGEYLEVVVKH
jgi:ubiquinone/menaquinone biosynthesis C-methylase UbiE